MLLLLVWNKKSYLASSCEWIETKNGVGLAPAVGLVPKRVLDDSPHSDWDKK